MILLIGATGFLGSPVLEELLKKEYPINCLVRASSNTQKLKETAKKTGKYITFNTGNLQSVDSLISPLKKAESAVYMVDLERTELVKHFISAAIRAGLRRVVFISSTTVLTPLDNKAKNNKLASENLITKSGLCYTILRPSMIYGSKDDKNFSKMLYFIKKRGFFVTFGSGNNLIQPVYIEDVAGAVASVLDNKKTFNKIYNLPGEKSLTYNWMLEIVREKLKKKFRVIKIPIGAGKFFISIYARVSKNPAIAPDQVERTGINKSYSYEEASDDFNFAPLSFEQGIERLIKKMES